MERGGGGVDEGSEERAYTGERVGRGEDKHWAGPYPSERTTRWSLRRATASKASVVILAAESFSPSSSPPAGTRSLSPLRESLQVPLSLSTCPSRSLPCSPSRGDSSSPPFSTCLSECSCVIDATSPPDQLEKEFLAWLRLDSSSPSASEHTSHHVKLEAEEMDETSLTNLDDQIVEETDLRKAKKKGTNLYGRPYCPGRPLSMNERLQIIQYHTSGMKVNAISKSLCISHGCVSKIITRYRLTGILTPVSSPEHRKQRRKKNASTSDLSASSVATSSNAVDQQPPALSVIAPSLPPPPPPQMSPLAVQPPMLSQPAALHMHMMPQHHFVHPPVYTDAAGATYSFLQPISPITAAVTSLTHPNIHTDYPYPYLYSTQ